MPTDDNTTADPVELFRTRNLAERLYIERLRNSAHIADDAPRRFADKHAEAAIDEARAFAKAWAVLGVRDGE